MIHQNYLDYLPLWALFLGTLGLILGAIEIGFRFGTRRLTEKQREKEAPITAVVGATLGLLAFMLAFTFGIAMDRFDSRRLLFITEVDAIGTAFRFADFLEEPTRHEIKENLKEYIEMRLKGRDAYRLSYAINRSEEIHDEIWQKTVKEQKSTQTPIFVGLFVQALIAVMDSHTQRVEAGLRSRIPQAIWIVLYAVAAFGMAEIGYQIALTGSTRTPAIVGLAVSFAAVLTLVADLDRPLEGALQVNLEAMQSLRASIISTDK